MVLELVILLRVQHFEQCRGRIAAEILSQLIDFIKQKQRIGRASLLQVGDNLARQGTDIGPAMPANFGFVAHTAQRLPDKLTASGPGDGPTKRGLADTGRADEAQNRALQLVRASLHREIFENALLDFFQREMVIIQDLFGLLEIFLEPRLLAPGQSEQDIEIVARHRRLGRHRLHTLELFQLGSRLRFGFGGKLQFLDLPAQLGEFITLAFFAVTQFLLDRFHLFVEIIFALGLLHLTLDAATDFLLDLQHAQFAFHEGKNHFKAFGRIALHQQALLVRDLHIDIGGYRIGEPGGIVNFAQLDHGFGRHFLVKLRIIFKLIDHRAHQG